MSSSCCGGNCGCGSGCKCGSTCTGCKRCPDMVEGNTSNVSMLLGVGSQKASYDQFESGMGVAAENDECKCGPNCTCNPCNCTK